MTRLLAREGPDLPEGVEQEGSDLDLLLDAGWYALEEDGEQPGFLSLWQLEGRRRDLGVHHGRGRPRRRLGALDLDGDPPRHLGDRMQPEVGGHDDSQGPERSREQLGEVVAGHVLDDLAAGLRHSSVVQNDGYADDKLSDGPVPVPPRPRSVGRDDAPDRSPLLRRIYGEHLVRAGELFLQI